MSRKTCIIRRKAQQNARKAGFDFRRDTHAKKAPWYGGKFEDKHMFAGGGSGARARAKKGLLPVK